MIYKTEYKNKETGVRVLVLMTDDYYAHYQQDGFIKYALKHDFTEQFEIDDSAIMEQGL